MTRLIDADALITDIDAYWDWETVDGITATAVLKQTITDIRNAPTVDAEPVRHGKWITCTSSEHWKCSECGYRAGYWFNEENSGIDSWERDFSEWLSDYCPNCGAKMEVERDS